MPPGILSDIPLDERLAKASLPPRGTRLSPDECKQLALTWSYQGLGHVSPNPLVGAVLVDREHKFISAGAHLLYGKAHAEVNALDTATALGADLKGSVMYVTLEPCAHEGNTPSCAKLIASSAIGRVVFGATDPNPLVQGKGAAILRASGRMVEQDQLWGTQVKRQNRAFCWNMEKRSIFYAMKCAVSLDGSIAREGDKRQFITNDRARAYGHLLRMCYDGIVVGWRTVLLDNPTLNVRFGFDRPRTPLRIVLDPDARCTDAFVQGTINLVKSEPERTFWVTSTDVNSSALMDKPLMLKGVNILKLPWSESEGFRIDQLSDHLWDRGIRSALLEGGAQTYRMFLEQRKVNYLHMFQAPKILTGEQRLPWNATITGREQIALQPPELTPLGDNWLIEGPLSWQAAQEPY